MAPASPDAVGDTYVLLTGASDAARLDTIPEVHAPVSLRGSQAAGIGGARRAPDFGCDTGNMSRMMAERILDAMAVNNARQDVWVVVAKMFACVGVKP